MRRMLSSARHGGSGLLLRWMIRKGADAVFGFGERPRRVIRAIFVNVVVFAIVYLCFEYSGLDLSVAGLRESVTKTLEAIYFSAVSSTALGYGSWINGDMDLVKYFGAAQSFVGIFLMALLLVVFARRWMR